MRAPTGDLAARSAAARWVAALLGGLLGGGCHLLAGTDEFTDQELGGGGGGEAPLDEICDNGVDDDQNGLADCDEPACRTLKFSCVEGLGDFRTVVPREACEPGEVELFEGAASALAPEAACGECSCATDAFCEDAALEIGSSQAGVCDSDCTSVVPIAFGGCAELAGDASGCVPKGPAEFYGVDEIVGAWVGGCTPSAKSPVIPPLVKEGELKLCEHPGVGCDEGSTCVGPAPVCLAAPGDVPCEAPWSEKRLLFGSFSDSRGCTECTCSPGSCGGTIDSFATADCAGDAEFSWVLGALGCTFLGESPSRSFRYRPEDGAFACQPTAVVPEGTVTGLEPWTLCCAP